MAEKISGIYRIVCVKNGRYYYGSAKNIYRRWLTHKSALRRHGHSNSIVQRTWNKYGENLFRCELTEIVAEHKLLEVEDVYLKEHVGKPNCMNIAMNAAAPMLGRKMSKETRRKMSESGKGKNKGRKHSEEHKRRNSETHKGKFPSMETRKKMSVAHMGHDVSDETRRKIGEARRGRKLSDITRQKISKSMLGNRNSFGCT